MSRDYYRILGVAKDADADVIKKAYRKLAMQFHPDRNPGDKSAEDKFKECAGAYEVLSNPEKRAQYDRFGHQAYTQGAAGGYGGQGFNDINDIFSSFSDIFGDIFGGRGPGGGRDRTQRQQRGADLRYMLEITLEQVMDGAEQEVDFETEESCKTCVGVGAEPGTTPEVCATCRGTGQVVRSQGFFSMATTCHACGGAGQMIRVKCKKCRGQGRTAIHRKIRVKIPQGVRTGTRLRVAGEGEGGFRGGPSGDLYVEIRERPDHRFQRRGDDLIGKVKVSYVQALLGAQVSVPTLKGNENLDIPGGTSAGASMKIPGKGVPSLKGYDRGDLYFEVEVDLPQKLSREEEGHLREIAKIRGESVREGASSFFRKK